MSDFDSSAPCQITIIVKFLLELQYLMTCVSRALSLGDVVHCILTAHWARFEFFGWKRKLKRIRNQFNLLRRWRGKKLYAKVGVINITVLSLGIHNREKNKNAEREVRTKTSSTLKNGKKLSEGKTSSVEHLPGCFSNNISRQEKFMESEGNNGNTFHSVQSD